MPQAEWVVEQYANIWRNNTHCDEADLDVEARQRYHNEHSLPAMESIRAKCVEWIETTDEIEPNSAFGRACSYFLNHFEGCAAATARIRR